MNKDQWDPEFLKAIPIMKTRSGMQVRVTGTAWFSYLIYAHIFGLLFWKIKSFPLQFSCASPSHSCPDSGCEVWVCNSDGYVGQVRKTVSQSCHYHNEPEVKINTDHRRGQGRRVDTDWLIDRRCFLCRSVCWTSKMSLQWRPASPSAQPGSSALLPCQDLREGQ